MCDSLSSQDKQQEHGHLLLGHTGRKMYSNCGRYLKEFANRYVYGGASLTHVGLRKAWTTHVVATGTKSDRTNTAFSLKHTEATQQTSYFVSELDDHARYVAPLESKAINKTKDDGVWYAARVESRQTRRGKKKYLVAFVDQNDELRGKRWESLASLNGDAVSMCKEYDWYGKPVNAPWHETPADVNSPTTRSPHKKRKYSTGEDAFIAMHTKHENAAKSWDSYVQDGHEHGIWKDAMVTANKLKSRWNVNRRYFQNLRAKLKRDGCTCDKCAEGTARSM